MKPVLVAMALVVAGCGGPTVDETAEAQAELRKPRIWWQTCGDVVCRGWMPKEGIRLCTTEELGGHCKKLHDTCDPQSGCNNLFACERTDPTNGGICPRSRKKFKTEIEYLDEAERAQLHEDLMRYRLAKYRYKDKESDGQHLGFMIDDVEPSPSVKGDRVDLYGYTSMAVAALQEQAKQIAALKAEIAQLKRELSRRR